MKKRNIVMDVTPASAETGIGRYTRGLAKAMLERKPSGYNLTLVTRRKESLKVFPDASHISASRLTYQILGGPLLKPFEPSLYLGPDFTFPMGLSVPSVVVVHDLIPWKHPEWVSHRARLLYRVFGTPCLRAARTVVADSEFTAQEFREVFHRDPEVVYPGISDLFRPDHLEPSIQSVSLPGGRVIDAPYLLFVGALDARRNAGLLLKAFRMVRRHRPELSLVLVGKLRGKEVQAAVREMESGGVIFLGGLADATLVPLYRGASAVIYISSYEGFGYPPLEGVACGVPVLVSDIPVFRETLGDLARRVLPSAEPDELCRHILDLMDHPPDSATRAQASEEVRNRFSWQKSAEAFWHIVSRVLEGE